MGLFDFIKRKGDETSKPPQQEQVELVPNEIQLQFVNLLFESEPWLEKQKIYDELSKLIKKVDLPEGDSPMIFFFPEFMVELKDALMSAQGVIIPINKEVDSRRFETTL